MFNKEYCFFPLYFLNQPTLSRRKLAQGLKALINMAIMLLNETKSGTLLLLISLCCSSTIISPTQVRLKHSQAVLTD